MKHGFDDSNKSKVEILDKEEVYALLAEAIQSGQLPSVDDDTAFVTKLKDPHTGLTHRVCFLTQAQYNQLVAEGKLIGNTYYFITDDTTADDLEGAIDAIMDGSTPIPNANFANEADHATNASNAENTDFTNAQLANIEVPTGGVVLPTPLEDGFYYFEVFSVNNGGMSVAGIFRVNGGGTSISPTLLLFSTTENQYKQCVLVVTKSQLLGSTSFAVKVVSSYGTASDDFIDTAYVFYKRIR